MRIKKAFLIALTLAFLLLSQSCSNNKMIEFDNPYNGRIEIQDGIAFHFENHERILHSSATEEDREQTDNYVPYAIGYRKLIPLKEMEGTLSPEISGKKYDIGYNYYTDKDGNIYYHNDYYNSSKTMYFDYFSINNAQNDDISLRLIEISDSTAYLQLLYKGVYDVITYDIQTGNTAYLSGAKDPEKDYSALFPQERYNSEFMEKFVLCAIEPGCISPGGDYIFYRRSKTQDKESGLYEYVVRCLNTGEESVVYDKSLPPPGMSGHVESAQWLTEDALRLYPVLGNNAGQVQHLTEASIYDIYNNGDKWITDPQYNTDLASIYSFTSWKNELRFKNVLTGDEYTFNVSDNSQQQGNEANILLAWIRDSGLSFSPSRMKGALIMNHVLHLFDFEKQEYHVKQLYDLKEMQHGGTSEPYFIDENIIMINTWSHLTNRGWNEDGVTIEQRNTAYFINCGDIIK